MPKGLLFGPDLRRSDRQDLPPKFKKTKKTKRKVTSRSKGESRSKVQRDRKREERKKKREDRLLMRAQRRKEEKQRQAEIGEPAVTKVKVKKDFKSNHGAEHVDATILKVLGRSHKTQKKMAPKSKDKKVKEVAASKWRPGMTEERHERRSVKAKPLKKTSGTEKMREKIGVASEEKMRRTKEKSKARADVSGEIVISSERPNLNLSFSRKKKKAGAADEKQAKAGVQQVVPTVNVGSDYEADGLDWAVEKPCKLVPIVDVGPDYEADGGLCGSGEGASELAWPLPIQAPLEPMPPCMQFYQVRRQ